MLSSTLTGGLAALILCVYACLAYYVNNAVIEPYMVRRCKRPLNPFWQLSIPPVSSSAFTVSVRRQW